MAPPRGLPASIEQLRVAGQHDAALAALCKDTQSELSDADRTRLVVKYLSALGASEGAALLRGATWLSEKSPDALLTVFAELREPGVRPLPVADIEAFMDHAAPRLKYGVFERLHAAYSDAATSINRRPGRKGEGERQGGGADVEQWRALYLGDIAVVLVKLHAARLRELHGTRHGNISGTPTASAAEAPTLIRKLDELLSGCEVFSSQQSQAMLEALQIPPSAASVSAPSDDGEHARAGALTAPSLDGWMAAQREVLLSRLHRHEDALVLLARELRDAPRALAYCCDHEKVSGPDETRLLMRLLRIYLQPAGPGEEPMVEPALRLFAEHADRLSMAEAMAMLPPEAPLALLMPAVRKGLCRVQQSRRHAQVLSSLHKARSVQLHGGLLEARTRRVVVDETTVCDECGKRIGTAAFSALPTGELLHVACMRAAHAHTRR